MDRFTHRLAGILVIDLASPRGRNSGGNVTSVSNWRARHCWDAEWSKDLEFETRGKSKDNMIKKTVKVDNGDD
ncbi:hypothetical protein RRF57_009981 [Xylaria bambusicola]|uniref:Uncharacterized protein n=1 Tax=Xylaria bambusicola TaxID=326684 RepID=A0AAN7Z9A7_9PEZI